MKVLTDRPLQRTHERGHDRGLKHRLTNLRENLASQNLQRAARFPDHLWLPKHAEDVSNDGIQYTER